MTSGRFSNLLDLGCSGAEKPRWLKAAVHSGQMELAKSFPVTQIASQRSFSA